VVGADDAPLREQIRLLGRILGDGISELQGRAALDRVEGTRRAAVALRDGTLPGGRDAFDASIAALPIEELERLARAFADFFHLINAAEEQHRVRTLRARDLPGAAPEGSLAAACEELRRGGAGPDDVQRLLDRLLVMPVLTAHPTEARRRTVLDHLAAVSAALDRLDDPRPGHRERARVLAELEEAVEALVATRHARAARPSPLDEVSSTLEVFSRTLLEVTPAVYRSLEAALGAAWPGHAFRVGPFLRWGTWVGGDRDGNPLVTAEVTRAALERQRALALARHLADAAALHRELSVATGAGAGGLAELERSLARDRERLPETAAAAARGLLTPEPWREKLRFVAARLERARSRGEGGYAEPGEYLADLRLLERTLEASGLRRLATGRLRDAIRRAEVFGFHLASMDLRQHSAVHERAVAELLAQGGTDGYLDLDEARRVALLARLLGRAGRPPVEPARLSPEAREVLATLEVAGRARRDGGAAACERYVVSFTHEASDLLEVLLLGRAAGLAADELRPVPLLEQLEDLAAAAPLARGLLALEPVRAALRGELEVMIGYSDSGKQVGYVASRAALHRAQLDLAEVARAEGVTLTLFHGRGGAVGRGGGPANRAIRAQPPAALAGRFRVTEQGETIAARYGRAEIAARDLEQTIDAVLVASWGADAAAAAPPAAAREREALLDRAAEAARDAYRRLAGDGDAIVRYALAATPIAEVGEMRIASRPASRSGRMRLEDLRAIPWVFSWSQSRHGLPGWFGLGAALEALARAAGAERARTLYEGWPFLRGLVDDARLALIQADLAVAERYARLAGEEGRAIFALVEEEHARTVREILRLSGDASLMARWPSVARTAARRNPYVDVLSHVQIELLRRLRAAPAGERDRVREALLVAMNGIAAGLQTVG
jgi:phosphoenolpyruvate carboxylase